MNRMIDGVIVLWGTIGTLFVGALGMFYHHGSRISVLEANRIADKENADERHNEQMDWMKRMSRDIVEIKVNTGGKNGKRKR